jgi:uncharacterized membrane protein
MAQITTPSPIALTSTYIQDNAPHQALLPYIHTFFIIMLAVLAFLVIDTTRFVAKYRLTCAFCSSHPL